VSSLKEDLAELRLRVDETVREARQDFMQSREQQSLAELNPPVAKPQPAPWDEVWKRRSENWVLLVAALVLTPICGFVLALVYRPLGSLLAILGFLVVVFALVRLSLFACPRCGRRFDTVRKTKRRRWSNAFTKTCLFCGLRAGTRY
jgi:hypothetical protein